MLHTSFLVKDTSIVSGISLSYTGLGFQFCCVEWVLVRGFNLSYPRALRSKPYFTFQTGLKIWVALGDLH